MAKYRDIQATAISIYNSLGNKINTIENIELSIIETIKSEKVSLDEAVEIILPELEEQAFDNEIVFA